MSVTRRRLEVEIASRAASITVVVSTMRGLRLSPFAAEGRRLERGAVYRNVYSVWAYDRPAEFDVAQAFDDFVRTAVID